MSPTIKAGENKIESQMEPNYPENIQGLLVSLRKKGDEVLVCIGELKENKIESNCGQ